MSFARILCSVLASALLSGTPGAHAAIAFDNGFVAAQASNGGLSDFAPPNPPNTFLFEHADDFTLAPSDTTLGAIRWLGFYSDFGTDASVPTSDDFTLRIFAADGPPANATFGDGLPLAGTLLASYTPGNAVSRVATASIMPTLGLRVFSYEATIAPLTLTAGTRYWLSIVNDTADDTNDSWFWAVTGSGNGTSRFTDPANPPVTDWSEFGSKRLAFQLESVPAPVPLPPAALGFCGALLALARRARAQPSISSPVSRCNA